MSINEGRKVRTLHRAIDKCIAHHDEEIRDLILQVATDVGIIGWSVTTVIWIMSIVCNLGDFMEVLKYV